MRNNITITDVTIFPSSDAKVRAYAKITLNNCFVLNGLKIIERVDHTTFVAMPSLKRRNGTHKDIAHPTDQTTRDYIEKEVMEAYEKISTCDAVAG